MDGLSDAGRGCLHEDSLPLRNRPMKCGWALEMVAGLTDLFLKA